MLFKYQLLEEYYARDHDAAEANRLEVEDEAVVEYEGTKDLGEEEYEAKEDLKEIGMRMKNMMRERMRMKSMMRMKTKMRGTMKMIVIVIMIHVMIVMMSMTDRTR